MEFLVARTWTDYCQASIETLLGAAPAHGKQQARYMIEQCAKVADELSEQRPSNDGRGRAPGWACAMPTLLRSLQSRGKSKDAVAARQEAREEIIGMASLVDELLAARNAT